LLARIDITGGSTGWHRAALIRAAIENFGDWWIIGTDYTRDWMPTGVGWSENHTDITNHYIQMGVYGGVALMALFICILWRAFLCVGEIVRRWKDKPVEQRFIVWVLGATLFGHVAAFMGISYFDQSIVFLYSLLAAIGSLHAKGTEVPAVAAHPAGRAPALQFS
jgi:hypothetical protein